MNASHLLFWLSARNAGTWQQFRGAVEELHLDSQSSAAAAAGSEPRMEGLPLHWQYRFNLRRLAHVEFLRAEQRWRVAPPVLAIAGADNRWTGILCGARLPVLI